MPTPQLSLLFLSGALVALALSVSRGRPSSAVNRWFAAQTILLALWVSGIAGLQGSTYLNAWGRFTFASAILIAPAVLEFLRIFPTERNLPARRHSQLIFLFGMALAAVSLVTPLVVSDVFVGPRGLERTTGPLYSLYSLYLLVTWAIAFAVFASQWRGARGLPRAQLQYLGVGIAIPVIGGITFNLVLPWLGSSAYNWLGPYCALPYALLVAHAIIRHRLMDLRLILHRGIAYAVATAVLSVTVIAIVHFLTSGRDYDSPYLNAIIIVGAGLAMLTVPAQNIVRKFVDPYFYRGRLDHTSALRQGMHRLASLMEPLAFAQQLRTIFAETLVPDSFTLVVRHSDATFEALISDLPPEYLAEVCIKCQTLSRAEAITFAASHGPTPTHGRLRDDSLARLGIELIAVLTRRGEIVGVVLLGPRRSGDPYFAKDLAFIESLSDLAAIALENTLLYRQRIHILEYSERLLESLDSAVVAIDQLGRITSHNPAASELFGLPRTADREIGLDAVPPEIGWALALAARELYRAREVEFRIDHHSRGPVPVILSTAILHGDDRRTTGALAVVTDLSTVKMLEQNQRRLEHLSLMASFYAGIAHEIRNPLAAISNLIAMLPDRFDDPEYRDTATRLLPVEVSRITALADRLRLMAPGVGGKLVPVNLIPLLGDIVAIHTPIAHESGIALSLTCPDSLPAVKGDSNQLIQLFVNLLRNAMEAMPAGGRIRIDAFSTMTATGKGSVVARILDDGVGIDPAIRSAVFEPFFTTKPKGTGLGLAICREIATFHGAHLSLSARTDTRGTVAELRLPHAFDELNTETVIPLVSATERFST